MTKLKWKVSLEVPDGKHIGEIVEVVAREEPYEYHDIFIQLHEFDGRLKYGCPSNLSPKSKLGKLLIAFGAEPKPDQEVDLAELLVGRKCEFMILNVPSADGNTYAEIVADSIKPS